MDVPTPHPAAPVDLLDAAVFASLVFAGQPAAVCLPFGIPPPEAAAATGEDAEGGMTAEGSIWRLPSSPSSAEDDVLRDEHDDAEEGDVDLAPYAGRLLLLGA
jgi:hypothetical protein